MTKRLFSTAKKRRPYRPRGYRSVFATDVDPETEEETTSEVSEEEVGLSADEFTGDLTDDPLADLADESIWAVTPGTDEDYSVTEDDFEREEAITNTSSRRVANDGVLESLNPTGTIFTEYAPEDRAGLELAPHIRPYSEVNGVDPDERMVVYRGVPKGVQSELADGDFITDMEQLAKDYAGYPYGDVISQEVFADEILDDMEYPMSGEYLFRPRKTSKKTSGNPYSVYHGTSSSAAEKIRNEGLKPPAGMGAGWFMLTDSYDQAARYAPAGQDPVVMEFSVSDSDIYSRGNKDSVLWQATPHSAYGFDANAYAVRGDSLPSSYLKGVHPVAGEKTSSRRVAGTEDRPGNIYRGIASDFLTDDEYDQIVDWARQNEFDPDNFQMAEPNFDMIYPILERLEGEGGLGRHWSIDYDVAEDFASRGAWHYDEENDRDEDDPDYRSPFGIVFRGDWDGEGVDYAERHRGYDGVMRPSNLEHEKEVTLHPGSEVNLLGMDVFEPGGFRYDIPVPDIKVRAHKSNRERRKASMNAINNYLRYAKRQGLDPKEPHTSRAYRRASRNLSPKSMVEISNWMRAQKTAHQTARQVLATTRGYRRKLSSSWHLDSKLGAYISTVQQKFACSCGAKLDVPAYNMCKCGKIWNAYRVTSATKGDTMFVVREVPAREGVVLASRDMEDDIRSTHDRVAFNTRTSALRGDAGRQGSLYSSDDYEEGWGYSPLEGEGTFRRAGRSHNRGSQRLSNGVSRGWEESDYPYDHGGDFSRASRRTARSSSERGQYGQSAGELGLRRNRQAERSGHQGPRKAMAAEEDRLSPRAQAGRGELGTFSARSRMEELPSVSGGSFQGAYSDRHDVRGAGGRSVSGDNRMTASRRRQAYDVEDDTYDFFEKARDRGYRFPKNMGDDPDSGTFQDELYNYTGGDRDRMRQVTDFARDNWGQHRNFDPYYYR